MEDDFKGTPNPLNPLAKSPLVDEPEEKPEVFEETKSEEEPESEPENKVEEVPEKKTEKVVDTKKPVNSARSDEISSKMRKIDDFAPRGVSATPELMDEFAPLTADEFDFKPVQPVTPPVQPTPAQPKPARPTPQDIKPASVARPVQNARPVQPVQPAQPIQQPTQPMQPAPQPQPTLDPDMIQQMGVVTNLDGTTPVDSLDPTSRPMKKAAEVIEKPKKKKPGLIVGIVSSLLLAVACITVAVLIVAQANRKDPMTLAVEKIMQQGLPEKVQVDGEIDIDVYNKTLGISNISINLDSSMMPNSLLNTTDATMNVTLRNGGEVTMMLNEIYAANGSLYIKTNGLADVMDVFIPDEVTIAGEGEMAPVGGDETPPEENGEMFAAAEETEETQPIDVLEQTTNDVEVLNDQWIRISTDDFDKIVSAIMGQKNTTLCTVKMIGDILKTRNTVAGAYLSNQFIASTDKDVPIEANNYPVVKLAVDGEKFANFIDGSSGSLSAVGNYLDCLGYDKTALNAEAIMDELAAGPAIYSEIDGDNNLSRIYFIGNIGEEDNLDGQVTADFTITYPDNVNVSEPTDYTDSSEVLQNTLEMIEQQ